MPEVAGVLASGGVERGDAKGRACDENEYERGKARRNEVLSFGWRHSSAFVGHRLCDCRLKVSVEALPPVRSLVVVVGIEASTRGLDRSV